MTSLPAPAAPLPFLLAAQDASRDWVIPAVALAVPALLALLWLVLLYNRLVRLRNQTREAWSGVDVQLKRRRDLVPNLVRIVEGYRRHEETVLTEVTAHRSLAEAAREPASAAPAETALSRDFTRLFLLAEAYPQLKADEGFRQLHRSLVEIEEHLQYARRYYNGSVRDLNNAVQSFPANLLAGALGFRALDFFEIEHASDRLPPDLRNAWTT